MDYYTKTREIKTGYILSKSEVNSLSKEEQLVRQKEMLNSREELRRLKLLDEELI